MVRIRVWRTNTRKIYYVFMKPESPYSSTVYGKDVAFLYASVETTPFIAHTDSFLSFPLLSLFFLTLPYLTLPYLSFPFLSFRGFITFFLFGFSSIFLRNSLATSDTSWMEWSRGGFIREQIVEQDKASSDVVTKKASYALCCLLKSLPVH